MTKYRYALCAICLLIGCAVQASALQLTDEMDGILDERYIKYQNVGQISDNINTELGVRADDPTCLSISNLANGESSILYEIEGVTQLEIDLYSINCSFATGSQQPGVYYRGINGDSNAKLYRCFYSPQNQATYIYDSGTLLKQEKPKYTIEFVPSDDPVSDGKSLGLQVSASSDGESYMPLPIAVQEVLPILNDRGRVVLYLERYRVPITPDVRFVKMSMVDAPFLVGQTPNPEVGSVRMAKAVFTGNQIILGPPVVPPPNSGPDYDLSDNIPSSSASSKPAKPAKPPKSSASSQKSSSQRSGSSRSSREASSKASSASSQSDSRSDGYSSDKPAVIIVYSNRETDPKDHSDQTKTPPIGNKVFPAASNAQDSHYETIGVLYSVICVCGITGLVAYYAYKAKNVTPDDDSDSAKK